MSEHDGKDEQERRALLKRGFSRVLWEDTGAHRTIFDDFDTLEHFVRLKEVRQAIASVLPGGEDEAGELVMMLEDLNPKLFNALGSAVRALSTASTAEDFAQVGISGRRYIEQLADALFPASSVPFNGRAVTADKFKNRLWAFIHKSLPPRQIRKLRSVGREVDRLIDVVNAMAHGDRDREFSMKAFTDLAKLTVALLQLDPTAVRQPYRAFERKIAEFLTEHIQSRRPKPRKSVAV
jgi:hypothetical protein